MELTAWAGKCFEPRGVGLILGGMLQGGVKIKKVRADFDFSPSTPTRGHTLYFVLSEELFFPQRRLSTHAKSRLHPVCQPGSSTSTN